MQAVPEVDPKAVTAQDACPICFEDLAAEDDGDGASGDADGGAGPAAATSALLLAHCRFGCGKAVHAECFARWADKRGGGGCATCVMCRAPWEPPQQQKQQKQGEGPGGYINLMT